MHQLKAKQASITSILRWSVH